MLSMRDCLDYCDLTEDEVALLAEAGDVPGECAAEVACGLVQSPEGTQLLTCMLENALCHVKARGDVCALEAAQQALQRFRADHPLPPA
ncbi:MAG: hypothetical protein EG825_05780 [Rhodocyclaceae bacterium]|nr:hypothetical protein [Rhodocyclaceae bacterium]